MKKLTMCLSFLWIGMVSVMAQNKIITVSGKIIDDSNKSAIVQAGLQLLSLPDSTYAAGTVSSSTGTFTLPKVKPGSYVLKITYVGYQTQKIPMKLVSSRPNYAAGTISLKPDAVLLKEAVVTAQAPPVTVKGDTLEYSASAYRVAEGAMLEDLVKKIPGVEVSSEGKITHNGKEIKKILVDGKEFFSDDPAVAMKNLPANMVNKVKAYDKKSDMSKYTGIDDGDDESVLDLSVKKEMKSGVIGNVLGGLGNKKRYEGKVMLSRFRDTTSATVIGSANNTNSRGFSEFGDAGGGMGNANAGSGITASKQFGANYGMDNDKVRIEGNVEYGHTNTNAERKASTETFLGNNSTFGNSTDNSLRIRNDARFDMHLILKPDTMTNIVIMPTVSFSKTNSQTSSTSQSASASDFAKSSMINSYSNKGDGKDRNVSLQGRFMLFRRLNSKGRNVMIGANLGYSDTNTDNDSYSNMAFYRNDSTSVLNRYTDRNSDSKSWGITASYTEPVFSKHYLQLRYDFSHSRSMSESLVYNNLGDYLDHSNISYSDSLSSKLTNYYNRHSFDLSLRGIYTKMMYSIGISLTPQISKSKTDIPLSRASTLKQNVLNYAPSVMFRYMFNKQHFLMFRYRGHSSAPNVQDLQEIISITDPLNLQYGNPNLKPSFSNNFTLFYNHYFPTSQMSINANMFYNNTINSVANKMTYNSDTGGRTYTKTNVNGNWNASGYFSVNTPLWDKRFTVSSNSGANYSNAVSYTTINQSTDAVLSNTHNLRASERLTTSFRTDNFDVSLNGGVAYNKTKNNKQTNSNRETYDYTAGLSSDANIFWKISLSSDLGCTWKQGYSGGMNKKEFIWNAQISKTIFKDNAGTIRFKIYDILRQQSNISRSINETMMSDTQYNTLGSYFMFHFVYRLNTLGGRSMRQGMGGRRGGFGGHGFGGPGGGFGGGRGPM
jgi:hypothetical protein